MEGTKDGTNRMRDMFKRLSAKIIPNVSEWHSSPYYISDKIK